MIRCKSYARAGLVGNPSDGYFGKTISLIVKDYQAEVVLYESPELEIMPNARDHSVFDGIAKLAEDVGYFGYYGGIRLLKATVKRFYDFCVGEGIELDERNFTIRYESNIPPQVGMAGSSAIITACLRCLMEFYGVTVPRAVQPKLILSVENDELGIPAGLQDRVIQVFEGVVFMDFDREIMAQQGHGIYEELNPELLPPLYVAFTTALSQGTEVFHNDIRGRFRRGDRDVVDAMQAWAGMAQEVRDRLLAGKGDTIGGILNQNFDLRRKLYDMSPGNIRMVEEARACGATAKFTGSGGAIVGTYDDEAMFGKLVGRLEPLGMKVFKPTIV
ncbi:N/A [soil metagenome]